MGCGNVFLKVLSGFFQTAFAVVGLGLIVYGSLSTYSTIIINSQQVITEYGTIIPPVLTVVLGILLIILVFVGCCGICRESTCCVESYSAFLILLALAHLALGGYCVIVYRSFEYTVNMKLQIKFDIAKAVDNYKANPKQMDAIQSGMRCCGAENGLTEYNFYVGELPNGSELPSSCCEQSENTCTKDSKERFTDGCSDTVFLVTTVTNIIIGYISLVVGATELIAALLGICLSCCVWRNQMDTWR